MHAGGWNDRVAKFEETLNDEAKAVADAVDRTGGPAARPAGCAHRLMATSRFG